MALHRHHSQGQHYAPLDNRRFATRGGRSPPRFGGDRPGQHIGVGSGRGHEYQSRPDVPRDRAPPPVTRGIPRGPRASFDAPRSRATFGFSPPRGRGSLSRGDAQAVGRNRESSRDPRSLESWGERDRAWRADESDRRGNEARFSDRDRAEAAGYRAESSIREAELGRGRVPFREESQPPPIGPHHDGSMSRGRGRGRGDWGTRGRGRDIFQDDRDAFAGRSRSPQPYEQRLDHDPSRPSNAFEVRPERRVESHDYERSLPGDENGRTFDPFTQDRAAARSFPRPQRSPAPRQGVTRPDSRGPILIPSTGHVTMERVHDSTIIRRPSDTHLSSNGPEPHRDSFRSDVTNVRTDQSNERNKPRSSSPPQATEVPAYGSLPKSTTVAMPPRRPPTEPRASQSLFATSQAPQHPVSIRQGMVPPAAPKAEVMRQPPTGPKAARVPDQIFFPNTNERRLSESRVPRDSDKFQGRSPPRPTFNGHGFDLAAASRPTLSTGPSAALSFSSQTTIPSGPRASAPFMVAHDSGLHVPTGPKASRAPQNPSLRAPTGPSAALPWQRKWPSTMLPAPAGQAANGLPVKRDAQGAEKWHEKSLEEVQKSLDLYQVRASSQSMDTAVPATIGHRRMETTPRSPAWGDEPPDFGPTSLHPHDQVIPGQANSIKDAFFDTGDEDMMEFDEQDFEKKEEQFQREKEKLEAEMTDLSVRHLRAATPLEQLALLGSVSLVTLPGQEDVPQLSQGDEESEEKDLVVTPELRTPDIAGKYNVEFDSAPITTADLQSLPFLNSGLLTPFEGLISFKDSNLLHEDAFPRLLECLRLRQQEIDDIEEGIRQQFRAMYEPWMDRVERLDQEPREEDPEDEEVQDIIAPLPLLDASPLLLSAGVGRRGGVGLGSEYDIERVLQESVQTANKEDERRRKLEASAKFDSEKEVNIPALLDDDERPRRVFADTRRLDKAEDPRIQFALEPPLDDFTEDEHAALILNFKDFPKKWGKIAQALGGRSYKDCINHYYSSKWGKEFKDRRDKRKQRSQRGRLKGGQLVGGRSKASALISNLGDLRTDLYDGEEITLPNIAVTDSGRPRRAAAPIFGDKESDDPAQPIPVSARKGPRAGLPQDASLDKGIRKPRVSMKERANKKVRAQAPNRRASESPEKSDSAVLGASQYEPIQNHGGANFEGHHLHTLAANNLSLTTDFNGSFHLQARDMNPGDFSNISMSMSGTKKSGMSSYWSVEEAKLFKSLASELGSDWQAIAQRLGTKTAVMAKNLYKRKLNSNEDPDLEDAVRRADERRNRGEPPGPGLMTVGYVKQSPENENPSAGRLLAPTRLALNSDDPSPRSRIGDFELPATQAAPHPSDRVPTAAIPFDSQKLSATPLSHQFLPSSTKVRHTVDRGPGEPQYTSAGGMPLLQATASSPPASRAPPIPDHHMWWANRNRDPPVQRSPVQGLMRPPQVLYDRQVRDAAESFEPQSYWNKHHHMLPSSDFAAERGVEQRGKLTTVEQDHAARGLPNMSSDMNSPTYQFSTQHLSGSDRIMDQVSKAQEQSRQPPRVHAVPHISSQGPRKQSNILSILNAEPDEPPQRIAPPRPPTPPSQTDDFRRSQQGQYRPYPDRRDLTTEWRSPQITNAPMSSTRNTTSELHHATNLSRQPLNWLERHDWAAQVMTPSSTPAGLTSTTASRSRITPFEHPRQSLEPLHAHRNPSPPSGIADWNHSSNHGSDSRDPNGRSGPSAWLPTSAVTSMPQFQSSPSIALDHRGHSSIGSHHRSDLDSWQTTQHEPLPLYSRPPEPMNYRKDEGDSEPHRPAPSSQAHTNPRQSSNSRRLDSFLLHGSGNYRSLSSQRDHHGYQESERQERDPNPFRQSHHPRIGNTESLRDSALLARLQSRADVDAGSAGMASGLTDRGKEQAQEENQRASHYPLDGMQGMQGERGD